MNIIYFLYAVLEFRVYGLWVETKEVPIPTYCEKHLKKQLDTLDLLTTCGLYLKIKTNPEH